MKMKFGLLALAAGMMASTAIAHAEGELNIFNWGNYTSPEMIKKFEEAHKVKVTRPVAAGQMLVWDDVEATDTQAIRIRRAMENSVLMHRPP